MSKAGSAQVRQIGHTLVSDHTRLDAALRKAAAALNVSLPATPTPQMQAVAAKLQGLSGSAFDRVFVPVQIAGHIKAIAAGALQMKQGSAPQAVQVAKTSAPVVTKHLRMLQSAAKALGLPTSVNSGTGGQAARASTWSTGTLPWTIVGIGVLLVVAGAWNARRYARR